jgi:hypothetical protein
MALQAAGNGLNLILIPEKHPAGASMRRLGVVKVFVVVFAFVFSLVAFLLLLLSFVFLDSSQASIRTRCEPLWARCLMGPDKDEFGAAI